MNDDVFQSASSETRFKEVFEQAPISMQLIDASGRTLQVNRAWEALWQGAYGDGLKEYVLHGGYNLLTDPQLQAKGVTAYLVRAFAGESVNIPAILYDPTELGIDSRPRWVTARAQPIRGDDGQVIEVMLMHEDITERVQAEQTLEVSEKRFRSLVTATSQMVWVTDAEGMIVEDSPSWRAFTGQTYDEWKGLGWLDAIHPEDRAQSAEVWIRSVASKTQYRNHYRVRRHDGVYRLTLVRGVPVLNQDGSIREWVGANTDVTEQRQAEEALSTNQERMRFVMDSMHQKIFTATPDGNVDYYNPVWAASTGLGIDDLMRWGWVKLIHPEDVDDNILAWQYAVDRGETYEYEHRLRSSDGEYRWHLTRAVPMRDAAGKIVMWIGSNTDIHEVKSAESELARRLEAEQRHSSVLARVATASQTLHTALSIDQIAAILVEQVRDILQVHQAIISLTTDQNWAQAINAISLSDKYADYRDYASAPEGKGIYTQVCRTNQPMRMTQEELERHPAWRGFGEHAGSHPPMRGWLAVPLVGADGSNLGLIQASDKYQGEFSAEDEAILTQLASIAATGFENARLYGSLQEQHRRKDEFLAMLAHELRNPLAPIRAAADLLSLAKIGDARLEQTSQIISRQVRHMSSLIDDLLDVSRVTRGLIELETTSLDVRRLAADAVEQARPLLEAKRHALSVTLPPEAVWVQGDHKRLVQILVNILNNAAKYTPAGGAIHFEAQLSGSQVMLSVTDNGIGIAPALQPYVFDLFAQAERSSDRSQGGLGIGLALVKSLAELHGGQVWCRSEGIGQGSRFVVALPRLPAPSTPASVPAVASEPDLSTPARRILVVDDNVDAAQMLAIYLQAAGHEVAVAHRAGEALQHAHGKLPDVCLLDIGLPDLDGNTLAGMLRALPEGKEMLLIAVTGYGSERDRESALAAGFDHHLVKPVDADRLAALLARQWAV